jgi:hypothetical protein
LKAALSLAVWLEMQPERNALPATNKAVMMLRISHAT